MKTTSDFKKTEHINQPDIIRISIKNGKVHISVGAAIVNMLDTDSGQSVCYCPSLNLTSYGETREKAEEMLQFCIRDFFDLLLTKNAKLRDIELQRMGWKQDKYKHKEFSKAFVDTSGVLQNFNVTSAEIKRLSFAH